MENEYNHKNGNSNMGYKTEENNAVESGATAEFTPKTADEIAKERKRELIAGAIGDSIIGLSNLYFAGKGAPIYINTSSDKSNSKISKTLIQTILNRHKREDTAYESNLKNWEKEQENKKKEEEANARVNITDKYSFKRSNWEDPDFINELYNVIWFENKDENLRKRLYNLANYGYYNPGPDEKPYDAFKGKKGQYFQRDMIEAVLSNDEETSAENRENIYKKLHEFENQWVKIK